MFKITSLFQMASSSILVCIDCQNNDSEWIEIIDGVSTCLMCGSQLSQTYVNDTQNVDMSNRISCFNQSIYDRTERFRTFLESHAIPSQLDLHWILARRYSEVEDRFIQLHSKRKNMLPMRFVLGKLLLERNIPPSFPYLPKSKRTLRENQRLWNELTYISPTPPPPSPVEDIHH